MAEQDDRPRWRRLRKRLRGTLGGQAPANALRRKGDERRDARDWRQAAALYSDYLARRPDDGQLWLQLGHALKEDGRLVDALTAYGNALRLAPNTDAALHYNSLLADVRQSGYAERPSHTVADKTRGDADAAADPDALVIVVKPSRRPHGVSAEASDASLLASRIRRLGTVA